MVDLAARGPCESLLETLDLGLESDDPGVVDGMTYRDFQKQVSRQSFHHTRPRLRLKSC